MEPYSPHKTIGITLGTLVVVGVLGISVFSGNNSGNGTSSSAVLDQTSSQHSGTTIGNTTTPSPSVVPTSAVSRGDDEGEGDDGGRSSSTATAVPLPPPVDTTKKTTALYKDGTYTATGSYMSPGGYDQIGVTLTLKSDIITDVSVTPMAGDRTSSRYQNMFVSGYKAYVVGQNIANVHLTRVSGSSLTPAGFDDALAQIKSKAKV